MATGLLITNVGLMISIIITFAFAVFVFYKGPTKSNNLLLSLFSLSILIFEIAYIFGINANDFSTSRVFLQATVFSIFVACFGIHWIFTVLGKAEEKRNFIFAVYAIGFSLFVFYMINPSAFLLDSMSKMYFNNYFNPGEYYWISVVFFGAVVFCSIFHLIKSYFDTTDENTRKRLKYYFLSIIWGSFSGMSVLPLAFDFPIAPLPSLFIGFYAVPLAYGIVKYDLMDIRVVAKRAFWYGVAVVSISMLIISIGMSNVFLSERIPTFPVWLVPFLTACVALAIGTFVWYKIREVDNLKYEFFTVVTHKFRTPLTYIKWAAENIATAKSEEEKKDMVEEIKNANNKLVELTDLLVNVSSAERHSYAYMPEKVLMADIVKRIIGNFERRIEKKNIKLILDIDETVSEIYVDIRRMELAVQIIIENAISYTPLGGEIKISLKQEKKKCVLSVKDTGIGISSEEIAHLFSKFFRGKEAKLADTEGMGIGLFMARDIIESNKGSIGVESEGIGKGSTFIIKLPLVSFYLK